MCLAILISSTILSRVLGNFISFSRKICWHINKAQRICHYQNLIDGTRFVFQCLSIRNQIKVAIISMWSLVFVTFFVPSKRIYWLWFDFSIAYLRNQWTELEKLIFFATYFSRTFAIRLQYFRRFLCFSDLFVRFNQPAFVQWTTYCVLIKFARIFLVISIAKDFILTVKFQVFFLRNKQKALENAQICAYLCLKWLRLITPYFSMFLIIGTYFL